MMRQRFFRVILFSVFTLCLPFLQAADSFATERLQGIAEQLPHIRFDTLHPASWSEFPYSGTTLVVRVNAQNVVNHIGIKMFATSVRQHNQAFVYDFVERLFLELILEKPQKRHAQMSRNDVRIDQGSLEDFFSLDTTIQVSIRRMDSKAYHLEWSFSEKKLVISFPMDYQLLSGCNLIELERTYAQMISQIEWVNAPAPGLPDDISPKGTDYVLDGTYYIKPEVRSDLFYTKNSDRKWELVCDTSQPEKSAANIALSPGKMGDFMLKAVFDQYGYIVDTLTLPIHEWIRYGMSEGGTPYFGIKNVGLAGVEGTIFFPNEEGGYCHLLSVEIPMEVIANRAGVINGRLYVYIPLHNVKDDFFSR